VGDFCSRFARFGGHLVLLLLFGLARVTSDFVLECQNYTSWFELWLRSVQDEEGDHTEDPCH
jgi:hypothetical protein